MTALDEFVLWDNTTMPQANVKDFIDAARQPPPARPSRWAAPAASARTRSSLVFMEKKTVRQVPLSA